MTGIARVNVARVYFSKHVRFRLELQQPKMSVLDSSYGPFNRTIPYISPCCLQVTDENTNVFT